MSVGVRLDIDVRGVTAIADRLDRVAGLMPGGLELWDTVGAVVESQVRRRMTDDQAGPDGRDWKAWSRRYANTRHGGHSLLDSGGDLIDSVGYVAAHDQVEVGSNMIYAATHQFGDDDRGIPARSYLGLSDDDGAEIEAVVLDWLDEVLA